MQQLVIYYMKLIKPDSDWPRYYCVSYAAVMRSKVVLIGKDDYTISRLLHVNTLRDYFETLVIHAMAGYLLYDIN